MNNDANGYGLNANYLFILGASRQVGNNLAKTRTVGHISNKAIPVDGNGKIDGCHHLIADGIEYVQNTVSNSLGNRQGSILKPSTSSINLVKQSERGLDNYVQPAVNHAAPHFDEATDVLDEIRLLGVLCPRLPRAMHHHQ